MNRYFVIYKPYGVVSQFSHTDAGPSLSSLFDFPKDVYPVGRLDKDSEGLLIITNDKHLHTSLLNPERNHLRTYFVQVEGEPTPESLQELSNGVSIRIRKQSYRTKRCSVELLASPPDLEERNPPIRFRKSISTHWLKISLTEGKNRQIRKMTASVGLFTLRLLRYSIEDLSINAMSIGSCIELDKQFVYKKLKLHA